MLKKPYFIALLAFTSVVLLALTVVTTIRTRDALTRTEIPPGALLGQARPPLRLVSDRARGWIGAGIFGTPGRIPQLESFIAGKVLEILYNIAFPPAVPGQDPDMRRGIEGLPPTATWNGKTVDLQWIADFLVWMMGARGADLSGRSLYDLKDVRDLITEYKLKLREIENDPKKTAEQKAAAAAAARAKALKEIEKQKKDLENGGLLYSGMMKELRKAAVEGRGGLNAQEKAAFKAAVKGFIDALNAQNAELFGKCWQIPNIPADQMDPNYIVPREGRRETQEYLAQTEGSGEGAGNEEGGCVLPLPEGGGGGGRGGSSGGFRFSTTMSPITTIPIPLLAEEPTNSDIYYLLFYFHDQIYRGRAWGNYADIDPLVQILVSAPDASLSRFVSDLKNRYGGQKALFALISSEQEKVTEPLFPKQDPPKNPDWFNAFTAAKPFWQGIAAPNPNSSMIKLLQRVDRLQAAIH